jgi:transposase InsO family protein
MTEEEKMEVAIFRFSVISDFVNGSQMGAKEKKRLLQEKCVRKWNIPYSSRTRISKSTIRRWIRLYQNSNRNLKSLYPGARNDRGKSRSMDEETCLALASLRHQMPRATARHLIATMEKRRLVTPGITLTLSSVYRFLHQQNLMNLTAQKPVDRRKFEAELPNDLWQSDVMHGPYVEVDNKRRKSYLIAILDDHSRLIVHGQFYLNEQLASYLHTFEHALLKRGLPRKLYVDNGPAFRSRHLEQVTAALGIALIHSKPYTPQGRGKIERFFRTVRSDFVTGFTGKTLPELNEAFDLWLNDVYHQRKHGATGQKPIERFAANMECLRTAPKNLKDYFRQTARRRVAKDRTVILKGHLFEAPVNLIGYQVELLYHADNMKRVEVFYQHRSYGFLRWVDLHVNCRAKRDKNRNADISIDMDKKRYQGGSLLNLKRKKGHG